MKRVWWLDRLPVLWNYGILNKANVRVVASCIFSITSLFSSLVVKTLTGHKSNIKSLDFHPFGDFVASGSLDTNVKVWITLQSSSHCIWHLHPFQVWDIRRKGCIQTYKGQAGAVNALRFSPDGQWLVCGSEDGSVKVYSSSIPCNFTSSYIFYSFWTAMGPDGWQNVDWISRTHCRCNLVGIPPFWIFTCHWLCRSVRLKLHLV